MICCEKLLSLIETNTIEGLKSYSKIKNKERLLNVLKEKEEEEEEREKQEHGMIKMNLTKEIELYLNDLKYNEKERKLEMIKLPTLFKFIFSPLIYKCIYLISFTKGGGGEGVFITVDNIKKKVNEIMLYEFNSTSTLQKDFKGEISSTNEGIFMFVLIFHAEKIKNVKRQKVLVLKTSDDSSLSDENEDDDDNN